MSRTALIPPLEAPAGTLFLLEAACLRVLTGDGGEAVVSLAEFFAFLFHLSLCRATTRAALNPLRPYLAAEGIHVAGRNDE